ncbi:MAG TPA: helicase-exonuclease AddAB subunit AddB [Symbiobacteriaceae bacterium]|jgi:ATP-dependent helicase/nuclease subunit B
MALQFILGRAGTGKTRFCLDAIRTAAKVEPEGSPLVLLVPEQATFQMEQALLCEDGLKGMMRAQVISFQRLAWRVSLTAGGLARPPLSDLGKQMLLRALVERRLEELRIFGQVADRPGFIEKLARTITELRQYNWTAGDLKQKVEALAQAGDDVTPLGEKLHDLGLVMGDLTDYTRDKFTDPDEYLTVLAQRLPQSGVLNGANVWVDSFTGFTPQEIEALRAIFTCAGSVRVSLCLDPSELGRRSQKRHGPTDLFHPTLDTYDQLIALAEKAGVAQAPPVLLHEPVRFAKAPDLAHLERTFLGRTYVTPWKDPVPSIAIVNAQHRRHEVEAAAREVLRLARTGVRYREISTVARNLDAYGDLVETVFGEHGIPVFLDKRRTVAHHPLVELLRSALDVIIQDWSYGPVFRYLKTDMVSVARGEVDALENYVLEHGIRGRRWHDGEPWLYVRLYTLEEDPVLTEGHGKMLEWINGLRDRAVHDLAAFHRRLGLGRGHKPRTVQTITTALFGLLDDLGVAKRLEGWSAKAEAAGDLEGAREHEQVWEGVLELMDQMVESLGDAEMSLAQYQRVLNAGLDGLRLGLIPPGLDQVIVGTVERSRSYGVKAALILGATERDFPPLPPEDVIFNDSERESLDEGGLAIGPTSKYQLFQGQFFTYVALTRGANRLWLSYPLAGEDGRAMSPSPIVKRLQQAFPAAEVQVLGDGTSVDAIATPGQLAATLTRALRMHRAGYGLEPVWLDLYQWAVTDVAIKAVVAPTLAALHYEEDFVERTAPLGGGLAVELYGDRLSTSVSRLESFAACPFQHFAGYGLGLRDRPQFQVSAPELGMFYHAAFSQFVKQLAAEGINWESLNADQAAVRMDQIVDLLAPRLQSEILLSSPQHRYLLRVMRRTLQASLRFLGQHIYQGGFRPLRVELPFGEGIQTGLPPVEVPLIGGGTVRLRGQIDRVDGYRATDGNWYLRVMDYKSSARPLDLGKFFAGLALQLPLYLYAVITHAQTLLQAPARPAGALYFPVYDPIEPLALPAPPEKVEELRRKRFKATGLVAADPEIIRTMDSAGVGLIQAKLNKDGTLRKNVPVATEAQFGLLFKHLEHQVAQAAGRLLTGDVGATPCKAGAFAPCPTCRYRAVCQFDPLVPGQTYRSVKLLKPPEVWAELEGKGGAGDE